MSSLVDKRREIRQVVLEAITQGRARLQTIQATSKKITVDELFEETPATLAEGWAVTELFHVKQGVTWGGKECETIFVVDSAKASGLEAELIRKTIGGRDIEPWVIKWEGDHLVFPYIASGGKWIKAFLHPSLGGSDALDFSFVIDQFERGKDFAKRLDFRIAKGIVNHPRIASYLVHYYEKLSKREFEGKTLSDYNKSWYEYHRSREPDLLFAPKIVGKRMMKTPTYALDNVGYLPRDSVMAFIPKNKISEVKEKLKEVIKSQLVSDEDVFKFILAFLNSDLFAELLAKRRAKKRGGYPIVDESMLARFIIPKPTSKHAEEIEKILRGDFSSVNLRDLYATSETERRLTEYSTTSQE